LPDRAIAVIRGPKHGESSPSVQFGGAHATPFTAGKE
jgi:hypothetical protein